MKQQEVIKLKDDELKDQLVENKKNIMSLKWLMLFLLWKIQFR